MNNNKSNQHQRGVHVEKEYLARKPKRLAESSFMFHVKNSYKRGSNGRTGSKLNFKINNNSKNVIVKITGTASSNNGLRRGIDYISRKGELPIYNENDQKFLGKDELELAKEDFYDDLHLHEKGNKKLVVNMVFSPPPSENVTQEHAIEAATKTIESLYPDASYMMTYHNDKKEHPHVHLNLKLVDKNGNKFNIRKPDLDKIKSAFAKELVELNYKAMHKSKYNNEIKSERNIFEVISIGEDAYNFEKGKKTTPYIQLRTKQNGAEFFVWGVELKNKIEQYEVKQGDSIYLKKSGKIEVDVPVFNEQGQSIGYKTTFRNNWELKNLSKLDLNISSKQDVDKIVINYSDDVKIKKISKINKLKKIISYNRLHGSDSDIGTVQNIKQKSSFTL